MSIISFDVDGTLQTYNNKTRWEIIDLMRIFHKLGHRIIVWSGGGKSYAEQKVRELGLQEFVTSCHGKSDKDRPPVDLCFDDEFVDLAEVNIKV